MKVLEKSRIKQFFYRASLQACVSMLAFLPANPTVEEGIGDMFDNILPRSIEHFASQVLMAMDGNMFRFLGTIDSDTVKSDVQILKAAQKLDQQLVDSIIPMDVELDQHIQVRMASLNLSRSSDEMAIEILKESVVALMETTISNYKYSGSRIIKMRKWLRTELFSQDSVDAALAQIADMISVLILKPQYIHHHSPWISLNKALCEHLGKFLHIDKLGVRQSMSKVSNITISRMYMVKN